jgi:hypothetical protein
MWAVSKKTCKHCNETKPAASFYSQIGSRDGLRSWCKKCMSENDARKRLALPRGGKNGGKKGVGGGGGVCVPPPPPQKKKKTPPPHPAGAHKATSAASQAPCLAPGFWGEKEKGGGASLPGSFNPPSFCPCHLYSENRTAGLSHVRRSAILSWPRLSLLLESFCTNLPSGLRMGVNGVGPHRPQAVWAVQASGGVLPAAHEPHRVPALVQEVLRHGWEIGCFSGRCLIVVPTYAAFAVDALRTLLCCGRNVDQCQRMKEATVDWQFELRLLSGSGFCSASFACIMVSQLLLFERPWMARQTHRTLKEFLP